jgi:D-alanyl-D-alanine carboxypeptidase (penicillin-binding protein 5/6)
MNKLPRLRIDQLISLIFITLVLSLQAGVVFTTAQPTLVKAEAVEDNLDLPVASSPVLKPDADPAQISAQVTARSIYVADEASGAILLTKNAYQPVAPASTTKLMTALVAMKIYRPGQVFTVQEEAYTVGNTVDFVEGEQISLENLLHALLIMSGNDAAFVLANNHPQGYTGFVVEMNQLAEELNLELTHFENPSGLDQPTHLLTARDLAILAREVMRQPLLKDIVGTQSDIIADVTGQHQHYLYTTNSLLGREPGVVGVKTGTTLQAGETLITQREKDGHTLLIVILGSEDRYQDTKTILQWIDQSFDWQPLDEV